MNIDDEILQQPFCLAPDVSTGTKHYFKLKPKQLIGLKEKDFSGLILALAPS
jgi:hypothetical protein